MPERNVKKVWGEKKGTKKKREKEQKEEHTEQQKLYGEEYWKDFFFKQKTAYEMESRDWSSDVCSSD
eukprot:COSAG06_NODE_61398_length_268_cov_0.426036_1_plen_66_part_01